MSPGDALESILTALEVQHQRKVEKAKAVIERLGPRALGANSLTWVKAADAILKADGLSAKEREFVRDVRGKMEWSAKPGRRDRYVLSPKQMSWFKTIYLRVVQKDTAT
jgi:hypothetical protein